MKIFMAIAVLFALSAVGGSVFVGMKNFDGTVTDHPYEEGLQWDEREKKKRQLGWQIEFTNRDLRTGDNAVELSILDKQGKHLAADEVRVLISRPATPAYDKYFDTIKVSGGRYRATVHFPLYGYWDVGVKVSEGGESLFINKKIYVNPGIEVH